MNESEQLVELLSPARDADTAIAAIEHGADAVYIGATSFGARSAAGNSLEDIKRVVDYAHPFRVKVYVTLNTIIYENELKDVEQLIWRLYEIGVDALIVQDMGILEMNLPPIDLHASTQTDGRSIDKIKLLAQAGFSQIVLPREFSLEEIREAVKAVEPYGAKIEVFVHGALCVSYSGDCQVGFTINGRSANRGECPQICRLQYRLVDVDGREVKLPDGKTAQRHWLSLADMNRMAYIRELIEAGVSSFKIEGRLKSPAYVKNVTAAYCQTIDKAITELNQTEVKYKRSSIGASDIDFQPDVHKSFNRSFTSYFLKSKEIDGTKINSWETPKWVGKPVGQVKSLSKVRLEVNTKDKLNNGDGLSFFNSKGEFVGFRVNKAEGNCIYPAPGSIIPDKIGTELYRNSDVAFEKILERENTQKRKIRATFTLKRLLNGRISIEAEDERGCKVTVNSEKSYADKAKTPQESARKDVMTKTGNTIYRVNVSDELGDIFIPAKELTELRRQTIAALDCMAEIDYRPNKRKGCTLKADAFEGLTTSYHDNVANSLAEKFYSTHGATVEQKALEVENIEGERRVMTTKYCLRRSLGACLKTKNANLLPRELYLEAPLGKLRLQFDCAKCNMQVYYKPKNK